MKRIFTAACGFGLLALTCDTRTSNADAQSWSVDQLDTYTYVGHDRANGIICYIREGANGIAISCLPQPAARLGAR